MFKPNAFLIDFGTNLHMCGGGGVKESANLNNKFTKSNFVNVGRNFYIQSGLLFPVKCLNWVKSLSQSMWFDMEL